MIVLPPENAEGQVDENSPLKGSRSENITPDEAISPPPPPPYGAVVRPSIPQQYPAAVYRVGYIPSSRPPRDVAKRSVKRFMKAFLVALLILFLWGIFIGSISIAFKDHPRHPGPHMRQWVKGALSAVGSGKRRQPERCVSIPTIIPSPGPAPPLRPLPINYPPILPPSQAIP